MGKVILGLSVDINICPQGVVCPCPGAIYMYKSIKIYTRTRCQVSVYRTTGPLVSYTEKTATLASMYISSRRPNISNLSGLIIIIKTFWLMVATMSHKFMSNPYWKVTDYITSHYEGKNVVINIHFKQQSKHKIKSGIFRPLANSHNDVTMLLVQTFTYAWENSNTTQRIPLLTGNHWNDSELPWKLEW